VRGGWRSEWSAFAARCAGSVKAGWPEEEDEQLTADLISNCHD
jgi:phage baseplate assembly protein gpV